MRIRNFFLFFHCCCCCRCQTFNKKFIIMQNSTHYKEFITVLVSLYLRIKILSYIVTYIKLHQRRFYTYTFHTLCFISFFCLVVILLILCVISIWDSAPAHSPPCKELNLSSQVDPCFSWHCTLSYQFHFILHHLSLRCSTNLLTVR